MFRKRYGRASLPAFDKVQISQIGSKVCEGGVYPPQSSSAAGPSRVSSCSRSSRASSLLSERVKIAAEENDKVLGSIIDPAKDAQNKEKSRSKRPVPKKTDSFTCSTTFLNSSVQVARRDSHP